MWGLSAPFVVGAVLVLLVGATFLALAQEPPSPRPSMTSLAVPFRVFQTEARTWALTLFYFLAFGGFVVFLYLPRLLVGEHHLTKAEARGQRASRCSRSWHVLSAATCRTTSAPARS